MKARGTVSVQTDGGFDIRVNEAVPITGGHDHLTWQVPTEQARRAL